MTDPIEITPEQLAAHPAVVAMVQAGAEAAVRGLNLPNPADRPGGSVAAPNINRNRPQRISLIKAIRALRDHSWTGSELERDFSDAVRAQYDTGEFNNTAMVLPTTVQEFARIVEEAGINVGQGTGSTLHDWAARSFDEMAARASGEGSTGAGGALVPPQYLQEQFVLSLQGPIAFRNAPGVDTIPVASQLVNFPRETAMPASAAYAEAGVITPTDPTFGQQAITIKKSAAINQVSNELLADSLPAFEQYIARSLTRSVNLFTDYQYLEGTGAGAAILGLGSYPGLTAGYSAATNGDNWGQNAATTPTAPGTDFPYDMVTKARNAGWEPSAWIMRPDVLAALGKVKDVNGRYILESVGGNYGAPVVIPNAGAIPTQSGYVNPPWRAMLMGYPVLLSTQIPINEVQGDRSDTTHVYLGDFNFARVLERQAIEIAIADQIYFTTDQTAIRVSMRSAIVLLIPGAFIKQSGVAITPHA